MPALSRQTTPVPAMLVLQDSRAAPSKSELCAATLGRCFGHPSSDFGRISRSYADSPRRTASTSAMIVAPNAPHAESHEKCSPMAKPEPRQRKGLNKWVLKAREGYERKLCVGEDVMSRAASADLGKSEAKLESRFGARGCITRASARPQAALPDLKASPVARLRCSCSAELGDCDRRNSKCASVTNAPRHRWCIAPHQGWRLPLKLCCGGRKAFPQHLCSAAPAAVGAGRGGDKFWR